MMNPAHKWSLRMRIVRYLALWTFICCASAAPSFFLAYMAFNRASHIAAMLIGIGIFIIAYTCISVHPTVEQFKRRPFVRRTLYIGYSTRLAMSLIYPIGIFVDIWCGVISVAMTGLDGRTNDSFAIVLITTLVQGVVLNVLLLIFMSIVYGVQRLLLKAPVVAEYACEVCGYDIRATPHRCPECGNVNEAARAIAA